MNSPIRLTAIILVLITAGCDDDLEFESTWTAGSIVVDGKGQDWAEIPLEHLEDLGVSFGVANDRENLYLLIVTWNFPLIRALQQEGLTLWFDGTSGKKKDFGLNVVGGLSPRHPVHPDKGLPESPLEMAAYVKDEPFMISPDGKFGPTVAAACQEGVCAYEIRLPLARAEEGRYGVGARPGAVVAVGVELIVPRRDKKEMRKSKDRRGGKGMGGMRGMGGRGGMGGRRGMGGRGGKGGLGGMDGRGGMQKNDQGQMSQKRNRPDKDARPSPPKMKEQEIWMKITLADIR